MNLNILVLFVHEYYHILLPMGHADEANAHQILRFPVQIHKIQLWHLLWLFH